MKTTYDKNHFIAKFEAIPEQMWITGEYRRRDRRCAGGHCGADSQSKGWATTGESMAFYNLFKFARSDDGNVTGPAVINDGLSVLYPGSSPKQRILAALRSLP